MRRIISTREMARNARGHTERELSEDDSQMDSDRKFMWGKNGQPNKAFERFPSVNGLIMHSDQGWQYRHAAYRSEIQKHKIIQSMSRKGNCYDNCVKETFFGRLKNEMFYGCEKEYTTFAIFSKAISNDIDYYNNRRIQPKTKRMPPAKLREASMMRN